MSRWNHGISDCWASSLPYSKLALKALNARLRVKCGDTRRLLCYCIEKPSLPYEVNSQAEPISTILTVILPNSISRKIPDQGPERSARDHRSTPKKKSALCPSRAAIPKTPPMTSMASFGHVGKNYEGSTMSTVPSSAGS
jgi:hypothetical protein